MNSNKFNVLDFTMICVAIYNAGVYLVVIHWYGMPGNIVSDNGKYFVQKT